jgi:hypothetical protein
MQALLWTGYPIPICSRPRLPHTKMTPRQALQTLTHYVQQYTEYSTHIVADSAFNAGHTLEESHINERGYFSIAINASSSCGVPIFEVASANIMVNHGRTLQCGSKSIIEAKQTYDHITAVNSNAWDVSRTVVTPTPSIKIQYKTASYLLDNEPLSTIIKLFQLPDTTDIGDPIAVLKLATGYDLTLPEPNAKGIVSMTEQSLKTMTKKRLQYLHSHTHGCVRTKGKEKATLIKDVLKHHPLAIKQMQQQKKKSKEEPSLIALKDFLLDNTTTETPIVDFYTAHYNSVDRMNKAYYDVVDYACHRNWP